MLLAIGWAPRSGSAAIPGAPPPGPALPVGTAVRPIREGSVAVVDDADPAAAARVAVDAVVALVRQGGWRIGVGAAPASADDGPVLLVARRALEAATRTPARLAVRGTDPAASADAQAVLSALAVLLARRSRAAWAAADLVAAGAARASVAAELGVSRQAVAQRLSAGLWDLEQELRPAAARLLVRAAG
ncbi:hypothetical protein [Geodermatophilus sp. URMC 62]|uniref:hypothetical protein n=1 Tax=Geodermatophilus sp. URMC 62 TaxID=3423414 RepID=UPI00406D30C4